MTRIALCGHIAFSGERLDVALADCAAAHGLSAPRIESFSNPLELMDAIQAVSEDSLPFDLVLSSMSLPASTGLHLAEELSQTGYFDDGLKLAICAPIGNQAADAALRGVHAFLVEPVTPESLDQALGELLESIARAETQAAVLRCRNGVHRVLFSTITYVETDGRDQLIHRSAGRTSLSIRCSSRTLFAHLERDPRFFKVGSSFIVNLDFVRSLTMRGGVATMLDGSQVAVPVRLRSQLADALCNYATVCL